MDALLPCLPGEAGTRLTLSGVSPGRFSFESILGRRSVIAEIAFLAAGNAVGFAFYLFGYHVKRDSPLDSGSARRGFLSGAVPRVRGHAHGREPHPALPCLPRFDRSNNWPCV